MPRFKMEGDVIRDRPLWGRRLVASVPAALVVEPAPDDPEPLDYDIKLRLDIVDGRLHCVELCAHQRPGGPPVTSENLRRVPVGQYVQMAAIQLELVREVRPLEGDAWEAIPFEAPARDFALNGMTDAALNEVARLYVWASATGDRPYGLLEREYSLPRAKASRWIATARRRGILPSEHGDDPDGS